MLYLSFCKMYFWTVWTVLKHLPKYKLIKTWCRRNITAGLCQQNWKSFCLAVNHCNASQLGKSARLIGRETEILFKFKYRTKKKINLLRTLSLPFGGDVLHVLTIENCVLHSAADEISLRTKLSHILQTAEILLSDCSRFWNPQSWPHAVTIKIPCHPS